MAPSEQVIVSATRITSTGFNAPTPTTVISAELIAKSAQPSVFETVTMLPALQGSTGPEVNTNATSTGLNGLSAFALRGLGTMRTLVLLDGQRVVPANVTGITDISEFPQLLIQRIDVVTGGASASWGSDAVAGVINFITDKDFTGVKANILGGITTYGDDANITAQAAAGTRFAGGRGHVEVSGEYSNTAGVHPQARRQRLWHRAGLWHRRPRLGHRARHPDARHRRHATGLAAIYLWRVCPEHPGGEIRADNRRSLAGHRLRRGRRPVCVSIWIGRRAGPRCRRHGNRLPQLDLFWRRYQRRGRQRHFHCRYAGARRHVWPDFLRADRVHHALGDGQYRQRTFLQHAQFRGGQRTPT